jgi:two-component system LytT family response regulator
MENALKTLIVDDESLARRGLKHRLRDVGDLEIIAEAANGRQALGLIREHRPDLVFLDIQMPGMDGFDVLRALQPEDMPAIVFVTAFDDYAIKAFEAHALDYLLKPIEDDRLAEALDRVREFRDRKQALEHRKSLLELVGQITGQPVRSMRELSARGVDKLKKKEPPRLAIRDGGRTTWVRQEDIEWIDAAGDYMCVHANGQTHVLRATMKELETMLDPALFQRVHRSTIVNLGRVASLRPHTNGEAFLRLVGGTEVKLSRGYRDSVERLLDTTGRAPKSA